MLEARPARPCPSVTTHTYKLMLETISVLARGEGKYNCSFELPFKRADIVGLFMSTRILVVASGPDLGFCLHLSGSLSP